MKKIKHFKSINISDQQLWKESIKHMRISQCLYPGCKNKDIIKSHALQNNGIISKLSENNQVCMPIISRGTTAPLDKRFGKELGLIGKNKATTFTGFCKEHDDKLFSRIEKKEWIPDGPSLFLFTYRTICSELQTKQELVKRIDYIRDKKFINVNKLPSYERKDYQLYKLAISDLLRVKTKFDFYLKNKNTEIPIAGTVWNMPKANFAISGYYIPYYDFDGKLLNNRFGKIDYPIFVNILPYRNMTLVLLIVYKEDYEEIYRDDFKKIESLSLTQKEIFLTNVSIKSSDNLIINPKSARKLNSKQVKIIEGVNNDEDIGLEVLTHSPAIYLENKGLNLFEI